MSIPGPSSRFPNTLFTSGTGRSRILDFDIPGGEQGAYDLLELDRRAGDEVLHKRAKEILLQEFNALRADVSYRSRRLAAVAIIACARSPAERAKRSALPGRWDGLVGLIYAAEAQYALETILLPLPGPIERWDDRTDKTLPPLMPATFVSFAPQKLTEVDEEEEEGSSSSSVLPQFFPEFTSLLADMHTNAVEYLIDGELSPGPAGFTVNPLMGACPPTRRGRAVLPPDEPLRLEGGLLKGMGGINRSQLNQLKRRGGFRSSGASGGNLIFSYGGEERKEKRRLEKAKAIEPASSDRQLVSVKKELVKQMKEEFWAQLDDMRAQVTSRTPETVEATVQTDPLPPPDPLIITRPSSPVFLPALPLSERELELLEEVDKLKDDLRVQRTETEKVKAVLRAITLENDDLRLRLNSSDLLLSLIHHTRPLVATVCTRFEPLKAVLPVAAVDWATQKGMQAVEGIVQREESEIGRLRREIGQLEKQLEAVNSSSSSSALTSAAFLAAHSAHSLSAPSERAAYATWRLGEQVKTLTRQVREMREENVDLIVQLSQ